MTETNPTPQSEFGFDVTPLMERLAFLRDNPGAPLEEHERRSTDQLRVSLRDEEVLQLGKDLAEQQQGLKALQDDKASIVAEFAAKIKGAEASMAQIANRVRMGYEIKSVRTATILDDPRPGMKTTYRLDTLEVTECRAMLDDEKQRLMKFMQDKADAEQKAREAAEPDLPVAAETPAEPAPADAPPEVAKPPKKGGKLPAIDPAAN